MFYVIVRRHVFRTKFSHTATDVDWAGSNVMMFVAFCSTYNVTYIFFNKTNICDIASARYEGLAVLSQGKGI